MSPALRGLETFPSVLREKRAEGNPLHAFTSPDDVAVVLASATFFNQTLIRLNES